jgi:hypothetical protein
MLPTRLSQWAEEGEDIVASVVPSVVRGGGGGGGLVVVALEL